MHPQINQFPIMIELGLVERFYPFLRAVLSKKTYFIGYIDDLYRIKAEILKWKVGYKMLVQKNIKLIKL